MPHTRSVRNSFASSLVHDLVVSTRVLSILGFVFFFFYASFTFLDLILRDFRLGLTGKISNGCVVGCGGRLLTTDFLCEALVWEFLCWWVCNRNNQCIMHLGIVTMSQEEFGTARLGV
ncbi:hypothetical protein AAZV13_14G073401 [Glycine max]